MTPIATARERPEFEAVQLSIDPEEATERVHRQLKGLSATETDEGIKLRTRDGMLVAILGRPAESSEEQGAVLAYRIAPDVESATRKARKVFELLEPYRA